MIDCETENRHRLLKLQANATVCYCTENERTPVLKRRWLEAGLAYGVVIFLVMNYVVLPLSAIGHAPRFRVLHFIEDIVAMLLFGTIVAFFARKRPNQ
jgi:hypothetical protein